MNTAIQQLDQVIQQNSSASEEMASTPEELSGQATSLQSSVAFFKTGDEHRRAAVSAPQPTYHAKKPAGARKAAVRGSLGHLAKAVKSNGPVIHLDSSEGGDSLDSDFTSYQEERNGRG